MNTEFEYARDLAKLEDSRLKALPPSDVIAIMRVNCMRPLFTVTEIVPQFERRPNGLFQSVRCDGKWRRLASVKIAALGQQDRIFTTLARYQAKEFTQEVEAVWLPFVRDGRVVFIGEDPAPPVPARELAKQFAILILFLFFLLCFLLMQFGYWDNPRSRMSDEELYYEDARDAGNRPF